MITYTCDQCNGPIKGDILITATDLAAIDRDQHFCSPICLSGWAVKQGYREAPKPPEPQPAKRAALTPEQDAEIARRHAAGERATALAEAFGIAQPTVYNAINRAKIGVYPPPRVTVKPGPQVDDSAAPASESRPKPETPQVKATCDIPAKDIHANVTPPVARPRRPDATAGCRDCPRTFNLTGRVLEAAIAMHELKHDGHIVDTYENQEA